MGFFKKLIGSAAVIGAAVGGVSYLKKRKEEKYTEDDIFEDFDDEKIFDIKTNSKNDGTQKITITFNSNKAKSMANNAADKVLEAADSAKEKIVDAVGEEKYDSAVKKVNDAANFAKDKASVAKDKITDLVGEERIDSAKDLLNDAVDFAKDKTSEVIDKVKNYNNDNDFVDADYTDLKDDFDSFDDDDFVDEDKSDNSDNDFDDGIENDDVSSSDNDTFGNNNIPSEDNHIFEDIDDVKQDDDSFEDTNISEEGTNIFEEEPIENDDFKDLSASESDTTNNDTTLPNDNIYNNVSDFSSVTKSDEFNELDDELNDDEFDNSEINDDTANSNEPDKDKDSEIVEEHFSFLKKPSDNSENTTSDDTDFLDDELDEI